MRMSHRQPVFSVAALATASLLFLCARTSQAQNPRVLVQLPGFDAPVGLDTIGTPRVVPGTRAQVFAATLAAFSSLEIPMTHVDTAQRAMLNPTFVKMRRIQKTPLSKYFNCGSELAGPNADHYRLVLAVAAFVDSTSEGTRVRVSMAAGADNIKRLVEAGGKPA